MKEFLVGLLTSRRVVAAIGGVLSALLVPVLNTKLGLGLDPAELTATVTGIVSIVVAYVVTRTVTDVKGTTPAGTTPPPPPAIPPELQKVLDELKK